MVNKVILVGNLGKDPEIKQFENNAVARFSLATNETYTDRNGVRQTNTEWHNLAVWGKLAEIAQKYLHKGSKIYAEGRIATRKYTDANNVERSITEIVVENFKMLDSKESDNQGTYTPPVNSETTNNPATPPSKSDDDDLPF